MIRKTKRTVRELPEEGLIERIVSFNVGIELGQIAALLVMFIALGF